MANRRVAMTVGQVFEQLTAIRYIGPNPKGHIVWEFRCTCGNIIQTPANRVVSGNAKSCGCRKRAAIILTGFKNRKHGHRLSDAHTSREYNSWRAMIDRKS